MSGVAVSSPTCPGCGGVFQTTVPTALGYVVPAVLQRQEQVVCQRCYRLQHYGICTLFDTAAACEQRLQAAIHRSQLVIQIVDVTDLVGSWIPGLACWLQQRPFWLVGNKLDGLPARAFPRRLQRAMVQAARAQGLRPQFVRLCSARTGVGMAALRASLSTVERATISIVGTTNVGKSTWLRRLFAETVTQMPVISAYPGTTVDTVAIPWRNGVTLLDTPGIVRSDRLGQQLTTEEAKQLVSQEALKLRTHHLAAGESLWLGGLVRLDVLAGERQPYAVAVAPRIRVHRTRTERATLLWERHCGQWLTPPLRRPTWTWKRWVYDLTGKGRRVDWAISGLGWITGGQASARLQLWVPTGVGVQRRAALLGR